MLSDEMRLSLPPWVADLVAASGGPWWGDEDQMALVLRLAAGNVDHRTGGPFGAAVFGGDGELLSVGVNVVEPGRAAIAHAEIVAIALAGQRLGRFDLGAAGPTTLVTSTEPCAMCLGAVPWSGVSRLLCGATDADARSVGFDEGDKPPDWEQALARRGIEVVREVCRSDAVRVLRDYAASGGRIYNASRPPGR